MATIWLDNKRHQIHVVVQGIKIHISKLSGTKPLDFWEDIFKIIKETKDFREISITLNYMCSRCIIASKQPLKYIPNEITRDVFPYTNGTEKIWVCKKGHWNLKNWMMNGYTKTNSLPVVEGKKEHIRGSLNISITLNCRID